MTPAALAEVLALLERLVAFDTRNPPRAIDGGGIFAFLSETLGSSFHRTLVDLGDGCLSLLAVRGSPKLLFNVHIDTVPADAGWISDPHKLVVANGRAVALGACDVKGAAACLLVAAKYTQGDLALLFTSDEEAGSSRCVKTFLEQKHPFTAVVVGEPTGCRAVLEHRGIATCVGEFRGTAGHASSERALHDSAIHEAVRWSAKALAFAEESQARRYGALSGIRFNLGVLSGGTKANMIASAAELRFGVRPLPDQRPEELLQSLHDLAPHAERVTWKPGFLAPPLPAAREGADVATRVREAASLADSLSLPVGDAVDFWTEAALFSASGLPALVYGPGRIAQAHSAGEWVALDELALATATYRRILEPGGLQRERPAD